MMSSFFSDSSNETTISNKDIKALLLEIREDIREIKQSHSRLESHNSFITKIYFMFRDRISYLFNITSDTSLIDNGENELAYHDQIV